MANVSGGHGNALHDWLTASAYVKGADQTARIVSRKKHRSKRKTAATDSEGARMEAEQRVRELWKLSNRHYRRYMNDRLLRELAPPLDAQEIGSLFAPPPWGEKTASRPFERVTEIGENNAQDMAAWEPFRNNVDMDMEAKALQPRARPQKMKHDGDAVRRAAAMVAWRNIEHQARDALRRSSSWHLVEAFEEKILAFLAEMEEGGAKVVVLEVDDPYHRMLLHGVSQFHGLISRSISTMEEKEEKGRLSLVTRVHIRKKQFSKPGQQRPVNLMQFLIEAKNIIPSSGAAA